MLVSSDETRPENVTLGEVRSSSARKVGYSTVFVDLGERRASSAHLAGHPRQPTARHRHGLTSRWSLRELTSLRLSQADMNPMLGGNAARIFHLDVPYTRLFKPPSDGVGRRHTDANAGDGHHPPPVHAQHHG